MAATTTARETNRSDGVLLEYKMAAVKIPQGVFVGINAAGYATNLADATANLVFAGVSYETVDNSAGNAGDEVIRVWATGVFEMVDADGDGTIANVKDEVFGETNQEIVKAAGSSTQGYKVGIYEECISTTKCRIKIDGYTCRPDLSNLTTADLAAAAGIKLTQLEALASAKVIVGSAANVPTAVDMSGDVTISNAGVTAIGAKKIGTAMLADAAGVKLTQLEALADGKIIVGSAANVPTAVTPSGDVTIIADGTTAIGAAKVTNAMQTEKGRTRNAISDPLTLTSAGGGTISVPIIVPHRAITITRVVFLYDVASDAGSVPNLEVGVDGALTSIVDAVAAEQNKALWYQKVATIAAGAVAADKAVIASVVAGGQTTNTGSVRVAIEYTVDD